MKKLIAIMLSVCAIGAMLTGCTNSDPTMNSTPDVEETPNSDPSMDSTTEDNELPDNETETPEWSEEMQTIKTAVMDALDDDYFPASPIPAETLNEMYGISGDMYSDYLAEMPMISVNVDTLIVVKAADGQVENIENALLAYQKDAQENLMNYPMNIGKIQASIVTTIDDYVVFAQLGGDTSECETDEEVMSHCEKDNKQAIEAITNCINSLEK